MLNIVLLWHMANVREMRERIEMGSGEGLLSVSSRTGASCRVSRLLIREQD